MIAGAPKRAIVRLKASHVFGVVLEAKSGRRIWSAPVILAPFSGGAMLRRPDANHPPSPRASADKGDPPPAFALWATADKSAWQVCGPRGCQHGNRRRAEVYRRRVHISSTASPGQHGCPSLRMASAGKLAERRRHGLRTPNSLVAQCCAASSNKPHARRGPLLSDWSDGSDLSDSPSARTSELRPDATRVAATSPCRRVGFSGRVCLLV